MISTYDFKQDNLKLSVAIITLLSLLTSLSVYGQNDTSSGAKVFSDSTHSYKLIQKRRWAKHSSEVLTFPTDSTFVSKHFDDRFPYRDGRSRGTFEIKDDTVTLYFCNWDVIWNDETGDPEYVLLDSYYEINYVCSKTGNLQTTLHGKVMDAWQLTPRKKNHWN